MGRTKPHKPHTSSQMAQEPIRFTHELLDNFDFSYIYTFLPFSDVVSHSNVNHKFRETLFKDSVLAAILNRDYRVLFDPTLPVKDELQRLISRKNKYYIFEHNSLVVRLMLYQKLAKFCIIEYNEEDDNNTGTSYRWTSGYYQLRDNYWDLELHYDSISSKQSYSDEITTDKTPGSLKLSSCGTHGLLVDGWVAGVCDSFDKEYI